MSTEPPCPSCGKNIAFPLGPNSGTEARESTFQCPSCGCEFWASYVIVWTRKIIVDPKWRNV